MVEKHINGLTNAETERLALLAEECSEVIQMVGKTMRYGWESTHPDGGPDNRERLAQEIVDVLWVLDMMVNDLPLDDIEERFMKKTKKSSKHLRYNLVDFD